MKNRLFLLVGLFLILTVTAASRESEVVRHMYQSAVAFLASLDSDQHRHATFSLDAEERFNWHYRPVPRKGVSLKDLTPAQLKLAHAFLVSGLSPLGYSKATQIMFLEQVLHEMEDGRLRRDPDAYFFSIFGQPSTTGSWGWRVEGHHLSLNFTAHEGKMISATPSFWGANPAEVRQGTNKGLRVLAAEEEIGRRLLHSFEGLQRERVVINAEAPADIITVNSREVQIGSPVGVGVAEMRKDQVELLMALLDVHAHRWRDELASAALEKLRRAGLEKIHFAWAGGSEPGQPHYYRIQGPTFVIEYDNTQNNANHVHAVWRDLKSDFGLDLLAEHYKKSHAGS